VRAIVFFIKYDQARYFGIVSTTIAWPRHNCDEDKTITGRLW